MQRFTRPPRKFVALVLSVFLISGLTAKSAHADIVSTELLVSQEQAQQMRDRLSASLAQADVIERLQSHGVDPIQAANRVAALSTAELQVLAAQFDELPAGGDVTLLLVVIILILLLR